MNDYYKACKYMVEKKTTIRDAAKKFNLKKSTLHNYIHGDFYAYCIYNGQTKLYLDVMNQIYLNADMKHIRGGEATKKKYEEGKKNG